MNLQVAIGNFEFFSNLDPSDDTKITRMYTTENGSIWVDDRWFQSLRRTYSNQSRSDLIDPIKNTWTTIIDNQKFEDWQQLRNVLSNLERYLKKLYGLDDWEKIFSHCFMQIRLYITDAETNEKQLSYASTIEEGKKNEEDSYEEITISPPRPDSPSPTRSPTCSPTQSPTQSPTRSPPPISVLSPPNTPELVGELPSVLLSSPQPPSPPQPPRPILPSCSTNCSPNNSPNKQKRRRPRRRRMLKKNEKIGNPNNKNNFLDKSLYEMICEPPSVVGACVSNQMTKCFKCTEYDTFANY